ncbi:DUF885 domain-containing protein [Arcticibacterium luteifluviistationis]|uniref:DUF885 domain-containing protein n=1 Tax=Arcticibacterium luteifluviistationis TaxID=1784714 RepID=A0A2Z4G726_9BACT|nr:DUF885 domain-containing protein [Arcticibacterium luteifluviistationis]AWV96945.1 DUF885 domain-containing protein [Arcticibacterium luteifluviistationis]
MKKHYFLISIGLLFSCLSCSEEKVYTAEEIELESAKANAFFEKSFSATLDRYPSMQTYLGIKTDYDKWNDLSDSFATKELEINKAELQFLIDSINVDALREQELISYKLFKENAENEIADYKWRHHNYPVNQMFGPHADVASFLINMHAISDSSDAVAYIARLNGVGVYFDQLIEGLKIREEKSIVPPKFVFPRVIGSAKNIITGAPFDKGKSSALQDDFYKKVDKLDLSNSSKAGLKSKADIALTGSLLPAYNKLIAFLGSQEERATDDDGIWKVDGGDEYYNIALKRTTTTDLTAEQIHEIGLTEVARIHDEMREIMKEVEFSGDLKDFFKYLKEDEQFFYPNTDAGRQAYLDSATAIIDNMRGRLDELFITKPKAEMIVKRVEPFREKAAGSAFYQAAAPDGSRPGAFYANLANMQDMPKYDMEALAYHEGIPGHHMDRSIAQELTNIPMFRKYAGYGAYVEGWGLYSEFIPKEMGLYANPYSNYGRLGAELWRACRLVVDTGIHLKKWTREEGIAYYTNNTAASERDCERMVERHIVMPSQATGYKIGMMKFLELRAKSKKALGDKFDLREFHEVVLTSGALPLNMLETLIDNWIAEKSK